MHPIYLIEEVEEAIEADDVRRLEELFQLCPPLANASYRPYAERPLIHAAGQDETRCLRLILEYDQHLEATGDFDWTPLLCAAYYQKLESMRILLEEGANPNARGADGNAPLHIVALKFSELKRWDAVRLLVEYGAIHDVGSATRLGSVELLRQLLAENPRAIEEYRNRGELLVDALVFDYLEIATILLEFGADPDWPATSGSARSRAGNSPGDQEIIDMILQAPRKDEAGEK